MFAQHHSTNILPHPTVYGNVSRCRRLLCHLSHDELSQAYPSVRNACMFPPDICGTIPSITHYIQSNVCSRVRTRDLMPRPWSDSASHAGVRCENW